MVLENTPLSTQDREKVHEIFSKIDSVIFDMDGLMIDSEPFHQRAFDIVFQRFGKRLTEEENNKWYVGISDKDATEDMVKRFGLTLSPEELARAKQQVYLESLQLVEPREGLMELLKKLQEKGYKKAIASSSTPTEIEVVVGVLDIRDYFQVFCSALQVEHGKPAPDLFLFTANKLQSDVSRCVVLEDAPSGIVAAQAASMYSIAIPSRETRNKDFSNASLKLNNLLELASSI